MTGIKRTMEKWITKQAKSWLENRGYIISQPNFTNLMTETFRKRAPEIRNSILAQNAIFNQLKINSQLRQTLEDRDF